MDAGDIEKILIDTVRLEPVQARVFLLVTLEGKMSPGRISSRLGIPADDALRACRGLVGLGGFIEMPPDGYEAMHPRFTAVNMYRRMCERENIEFGRNKAVDNIGAVLEGRYDDARTK